MSAAARSSKPDVETSAAESYLGSELKHIDALGKALKAKLDGLWVDWNYETQSGAVYSHHQAAGWLADALHQLHELERYLKSKEWPA